MDIKKSAVLAGLFFSLIIFACDRGDPNSKKTSEQTTQSEDITINTPVIEEMPTVAPIDDNILSEDTIVSTAPATVACPIDNFQIVNIGQDIVTDCENNQIAFSFLRTDDTLLIKIFLNATEKIFGINLEILYSNKILEFISYEKGEFFGTDSVTLYNIIEENACNKSLILGHTRLGYQTTGSDGVGNIGTLRWRIVDSSSKIQFQIKNIAVSKRFFDEEPIPRSCQPVNLVLNL